MAAERIWLGVGLLGQTLFASRFLVQWIKSELQGRSVLPTSFWYLSLLGSAILLVYAVYRLDVVFIVGQSFGLVVYGRNLLLIRRERDGGGVAPQAAS